MNKVNKKDLDKKLQEQIEYMDRCHADVLTIAGYSLTRTPEGIEIHAWDGTLDVIVPAEKINIK